jgi:hypothetical protein
MTTWAATEMQQAQLGDGRLNKRLVRLVEALAAAPTASIPQACGGWAATKAAYRFFDSEKAHPTAILEPHIKSSLQRLSGHKCVLAISDTTSLDFTHHPATSGLGPLEGPSCRGILMHSVLMVSIHGVPLGLLHHKLWAREGRGKRHTRRKRLTKDKESQKWLDGLSAIQERISGPTEVIMIADREADIYDLLAAPRRAGVHLLIRATHNRRVDHQARYLWDAISQAPVAGQLTLELKRKDDQPARQATLTVRYGSLEIQPPRHQRQRKGLLPIRVGVILAQEDNPPPGVSPVCWLLLTTLRVESFQEAVQCVVFYSFRWLIERYHYVLKSGCAVEELQLEEAERLMRAVATYAVVAWRLLWLTYEARKNADAPCDGVLEAHEWQSLYCVVHKTPTPPDKPPSLKEAVRLIARLGGFLGRTHDGEPGVKAIWQGLRRLTDIAETYRLLRPGPSIHSSSLSYG